VGTGTGLVLFAGTRSHFIGLPATLVLFFFALLSIGLTYPNAAAIGLAPFSRDAGSASALLGFLQAGTGSLISTGIGVLGPSSIVSLSSGAALIALLILIAGRTRIVELIEAPEGEALSVVH
jgi:DHA1 family bicyclomycin/chloramphenicol resistance-like MFS transporter